MLYARDISATEKNSHEKANLFNLVDIQAKIV